MLSTKYLSPWKLISYILLSILKSLQVVFVAYIFNLYISFAQSPNKNIISLTLFALGGLMIFCIVGIMYQYLFANIVSEINIKIKKQIATYLVITRDKKNIIDTSFMTNDLKQLETYKIEAELQIIFNCIQFLAAIISAFTTSWVLSLIFLIASFIPALIQNIFGPKIEIQASKWEKSNSNYTEKVSETIKINSLANLYNIQSNIIKRLTNSAIKMETALKNSNIVKQTTNEITTTSAYIFSMIIPFSIGIYLVTQGKLTLGMFIMISQLANNFINPVVNIFAYISDIKTTNPILKKIKLVLNTHTDYDFLKISKVNTFKNLELKKACINLEDKTIFKNLTLKIEAGDKVLLKAPSGWGKSTLLNALIGNSKLSSGSFTINGKDSNGNWKDNHEYFSFVPQEPIILNDTLRYNITLGKDIPTNILNNVITQAGLNKLLYQKGWSYRVGKNGCNLSGGQKQRIEIARALLSQRQILIADEATSALDSTLSKMIHKTILSNSNLTVIEVAHKISSEEQKLFNKVIDLQASTIN